MIPRTCACFLLVMSCFWGAACRIRPPATVPSRMIEPQLIEPQLAEPPKQGNGGAGSIPVRLLDTQARGHIGRRLLHQQPNSELTEDPVWRWSSAPDRYLDLVLRMELSANPAVRLVDSAAATSIAATLLVWNVESAAEKRLVGVVEFQFIGTDRVVRTQVVRASEPISADLPGNLADAAGSLLRRLASDGVKRMAR